MKYLIINGPNLNLLGLREPGIYGSLSFDEFLTQLRAAYPDVQIDYFQSNSEGELVTAIQQAYYGPAPVDGVILNAGAYTHTSVAMHDAIRAIKIPVIEVHISNVHQREEFRHHSYISPAASGIIVGFGLDGYRLALEGLIHKA